jgi:hypothetical protein
VRVLSLRWTALVVAAALASAGCQNADVTRANQQPTLAVLPSSPPPNGAADNEEFELCKFGSSATFSFSVIAYGGPGKTNPGAPQTGSGLVLNDGDCRVIAVYGGNGADVTVTETAAQTGFHLDRVDVSVISGGVTTKTTVAGPSVTEFISGINGGGPRGALAEFFNAGEELGGEGCTPGYWKQSQHFDSWPAPYHPTDQFSQYFENAFPGQSLLQVLSQGGGKLIALGRQTVAALLNAAASGVNYNLTVQQVIDEFNATFPSSNYGPQKDRFEGFNTQGCPLN